MGITLSNLKYLADGIWAKAKAKFAGRSQVTEITEGTTVYRGYLEDSNGVIMPRTNVDLIEDRNGRLLGDIMGQNEKEMTVTIKASDWQGTTAPYTNTVALEDTLESDTIDLTTPTTITKQQINAYQVAEINNATQADGSVTLYAWGIKPSIDLPMRALIRGTSVKTSLEIEMIETLNAGETEVVFVSDDIKIDSMVDIYTSEYGVSPTDVSVEAGKITLVFKAQEVDMDVKVVFK